MNIKFWGVRGSIPSTLMTEQWAQHFKNMMHDFFRQGNQSAAQIDSFIQSKGLPQVGGYGSATTCVEISAADKSIIIDGGSGIKNLNDALIAGLRTPRML